MPKLVLPKMIDVLQAIRECLALKGNDFAWSSWKSRAVALDEIDGFIHALQCRTEIDTLALSILFAPTGPIQEVSLSSGWGQNFIDIADGFDLLLDEYVA